MKPTKKIILKYGDYGVGAENFKVNFIREPFAYGYVER